MRHLTQPKVMARAAAAGALTTLACLPALMMGVKVPSLVPLGVFLFVFCISILWGFVFAWHFEYSGRPVFLAPFQPRLWLAATAWAVALAVLEYFTLDPPLRRLVPAEYPATLGACVAMGTFQILFVPLYVCFAPLAFFIRLTHRSTVSTTLVVLWGLFVAYLRLGMLPTLPSLPIAAAILGLRVVGGFVTVYFYLNAGAPMIWWMGLLLNARLFLELPH
jgi:hypothetical protein